MRVEWLPIALADRERQLTYIAERNPRAAVDMGDAIEAAAGRVSRLPHSGRPRRVNGTRELVINRTPYILAYRIEPTALVILRLLHSSQEWARADAALPAGRATRLTVTRADDHTPPEWPLGRCDTHRQNEGEQNASGNPDG